MRPSDSSSPMQAHPVSLLVCALGGEGGGVLTEWLIDAARHAGYPAQATSIPGVAQRTGATTYYLEFFPVHESALGGRRPVLGLYPVPGRLDALLSSELLETVRQMSLGHASRERTLVLSSSARALTTMEKMQMGDGRRDTAALMELVAAHSRAHHIVDMAELTRHAGTVVSAVMLGCIAASGLLPMTREDFEHVLGSGGASARASLKGFALGYDAVLGQRSQAQYLDALLAPDARNGAGQIRPASTPGSGMDVRPAPAMAASADTLPGDEAPTPLPPDLAAAFPAAVQALLALGYSRLVAYQGESYARLYAERLQRVLRAERQSDPEGLHGGELTRETARWLTLWMAYDDIIRVADLKSQGERWRRVLTEVKAGDGDLVRLYDHFKPGVPELAGVLPAALARRLVAWDRRRTLSGKTPWALPLKIGTHTIVGMLALRTLASLRWLRPLGSRHATEQALIEEWLESVVTHGARHWATGLGIAQCGRLIKGYGSTNERGKDNLLHVLRHLADGTSFESDDARAAAIAQARSAALADEGGQALDRTLVAHGAPARPIREQPIRWMRRRGAAASPSQGG